MYYVLLKCKLIALFELYLLMWHVQFQGFFLNVTIFVMDMNNVSLIMLS